MVANTVPKLEPPHSFSLSGLLGSDGRVVIRLLSSPEKQVEELALTQHSPQFPESEEGNEKRKDDQIADEHLIDAHIDPLVERQSFNRLFENVKGCHKQAE
jgi:hypothetical protein